MRTESLRGAGGGGGGCWGVGWGGCCDGGVRVGWALAATAGSGWTGSMCWAVWLKKRKEVVAIAAGVVVAVAGAIVGRRDGRRRVTGVRSSRTERSNALLMAGGCVVFVTNWVGRVRALAAVTVRCRLRDGLDFGSWRAGGGKFGGLSSGGRSAGRQEIMWVHHTVSTVSVPHLGETGGDAASPSPFCPP